MCVCVSVRACVHACIRAGVRACVYECMRVCVCACVNASVSVCVCVCVCMCACKCQCVRIHVCVHALDWMCRLTYLGDFPPNILDACQTQTKCASTETLQAHLLNKNCHLPTRIKLTQALKPYSRPPMLTVPVQELDWLHSD